MMLLHSAATEINADISPDGRWLAYQSDETGESQVWVRPFPNVGTQRLQVSTAGERPLWSRTGRELFYSVAPDTIMAVPVRQPPTVRRIHLRRAFKDFVERHTSRSISYR